MQAASKDGAAQLQLSMQSTHAESEDVPGCSSPESYSGDESPCSSPTLGRLDQRTEQARALRLTKLAERSSGAAERDLNWRKRLVRKKVHTLLDEVLMRQKLRDRQRHQKRTMEQRAQADKGPEARLGEAHTQALGLGDPIGSPRRQMCLKLLSNDELRMIRDDPTFFLDDGREERGAGLLLFFTPQKAEVDDLEHYIHRLQREVDELRTRSQTSLPWVPQPKKRASKVAGTETWHLGDKGWTPSKLTKQFTTMPCLCGKPPLWDDTKSPILQRVKEICDKRDEINDKLIEQRMAEVTRRAAVNAFKVKQQQLELNSKLREKKELSKVLAAETQARKDEIDILAQQHADDLAEQRLRNLDHARVFREFELQQKRAKVTVSLERCEEVTEAAEDQQQLDEILRKRAALQRRAAVDERIREWAEHRYDKWRTVTEQEHLRTRIQRCLKAQSESNLEVLSMRRGHEMEERQQKAKERRTAMQNGTHDLKYNFVEKAFGAEALKDDPRLQSFVSRRIDQVRRTL